MMRKLAAIVVLLAAPSAGAEDLRFDETLVLGESHNPEITVVISRENLNKQYELELKESFIKKIVESVRHDPF